MEPVHWGLILTPTSQLAGNVPVNSAAQLSRQRLLFIRGPSRWHPRRLFRKASHFAAQYPPLRHPYRRGLSRPSKRTHTRAAKHRPSGRVLRRMGPGQQPPIPSLRRGNIEPSAEMDRMESYRCQRKRPRFLQSLRRRLQDVLGQAESNWKIRSSVRQEESSAVAAGIEYPRLYFFAYNIEAGRGIQ